MTDYILAHLKEVICFFVAICPLGIALWGLVILGLIDLWRDINDD